MKTMAPTTPKSKPKSKKQKTNEDDTNTQQQEQQSITAASEGEASSTALTEVDPSHLPSVAGSVITASDSLGGTSFIRIQNITCTANLGVKLNLKEISLRCRNTEFNPRRFAAVIMRLREPRATALIFASGKMCVTGTKSSHNAMLAAKKFAYIVERCGYKAQDAIDFKIQNIVGTVDVGFPIRLEGMVYAHSTFASYEPELFPGLIYRLVSPRTVFLIFVSGKVVITGAKTEADLAESMTKIHPLLLEYRKTQVAPMPGSIRPGNAALPDAKKAALPSTEEPEDTSATGVTVTSV